MPRAIISVYDKSKLEEFARGLSELGWDLVASGAQHGPGIRWPGSDPRRARDSGAGRFFLVVSRRCTRPFMPEFWRTTLRKTWTR